MQNNIHMQYCLLCNSNTAINCNQCNTALVILFLNYYLLCFFLRYRLLSLTESRIEGTFLRYRLLSLTESRIEGTFQILFWNSSDILQLITVFLIELIPVNELLTVLRCVVILNDSCTIKCVIIFSRKIIFSYNFIVPCFNSPIIRNSRKHVSVKLEIGPPK